MGRCARIQSVTRIWDMIVLIPRRPSVYYDACGIALCPMNLARLYEQLVSRLQPMFFVVHVHEKRPLLYLIHFKGLPVNVGLGTVDDGDRIAFVIIAPYLDHDLLRVVFWQKDDGLSWKLGP